jgi:cell division protein FtsA
MTRPVLPQRLNGANCRLHPKRASTVSVLDVGSSKIACLIARLKPHEEADILAGRTHSIEVLGYGYQRSRGVKSGLVVDLDQAEHAIRLAVDSAERMAGVTIESLIVAQTSGRIASETFSAEVELEADSVARSDIERELSAGSMHSVRDGRTVLHSLPVGYRLDGHPGIRDPRGMVADTLGVDVHVVAADTAAQINLALCIDRCHLDVEAVVASPYEWGLATLVGDEAELGAVCIDIGGGTSSIAIFGDGQLLHVDAIAIGGRHVTLDIANALSIKLDEAERLKALQATALIGSDDDRHVVTIHPIGDDDYAMPREVPRSLLAQIVRPRVEEILELVRDRLATSGYAGRAGRRIILTGGGAQLTGLADVAREILGRSIRLGRPLGVAGLPEAAKGPPFAAVVGLLIYPQLAPAQLSSVAVGAASRTGTFAKVGRWLRESF